MTLQNLIRNGMIALAMIAGFANSSSAGDFGWEHAHPSRDLISGEGRATTRYGDQFGACREAEYRAEQDLQLRCSGPGRIVTDRLAGRCDCYRLPNYFAEYECRQVVRATCESIGYDPGPRPIPQPGYGGRIVSIIGQGSGGTTAGDKNAACDRARERAYDDARFSCSARQGFPLDSTYSSCRCDRKPGTRDDYVCRTEINLNCRL